MSRLMSFKTGLPGTYDLARCLIESMEGARSFQSGRHSRLRGDDASVCQSRAACATRSWTDASLLLGRFSRLPRRFLFVRGLVKASARALRDVTDNRPGGLVVDREETVGTVESLLHLRREAVVVEATEHLVDELGIEVVRVGE